jgi:hypothetical protein
MPTDRVVLDAVRSGCWRDNGRLYRAYLVNGELLLLPVGMAELGQSAIHAPGGLVQLIATICLNIVGWWQRQRHENKWRALDGATDDELLAVADEPGSFRLALADLRDVALQSSSVWLSLAYCAPSHAGVLRLTHTRHGRLAFLFPTSHDMLTAFEALRPLLGDRLAVNVV